MDHTRSKHSHDLPKVAYVIPIISILIFSLPCLANDGIYDSRGIEFKPFSRQARVLSLAPNASELIAFVGATTQLVGRTENCNFPPEIAKVPAVKGPFNINFEWVLRQKPDLVMMTDGADHTREKLKKMNIPVFTVSLEKVEELPRQIRVVGRLLGRGPEAIVKAKKLSKEINLLRLNQPKRKTRVFWEIWSKPIMSVGARSFVGDAIRYAGGQNIFGDVQKKWPVVDEDTILRKQPQLIFTLNKKEFLERRQHWIKALNLHESQIVQIENPDQIHRPTPRLVTGIKWIKNVIENNRH